MSARGVSRSFPLPSPIKVEEDVASMVITEKQGIVTILGSDSSQLNKVASLRRTLSADMSSKKWLAQNGFFSPMKRIASSEELSAMAAADHHSSSSSDAEYAEAEAEAVADEGNRNELNIPGQDDVWRSIQSAEGKIELKKPTQLNVWSSILAEKTSFDSSNSPPVPYIHPLVKRSASTLSEKSLEICTESLGSETGSDGFSSYPSSETGDAEDDKEDSQQQQEQEKEEAQVRSFEELRVAKYNYNPGKRLPPRSFPPPLPSLARGDGPSIHMHSHRKNGRFVLEAVSVPKRNYFHTKRQEGRLLLSFVNCPASQEPGREEMEDKIGEFEEVFDNFEEEGKNEAAVDEAYDYSEEDEEEQEEEEEEEEEAEKQMEFVLEQSSSMPSGDINVHRSALMMKRLMRMDNKDPTWSNKLNKSVNLMEVEDLTPIPQSLPPAPRVARLIPSPSPASAAAAATATAASLNAFEYFWKKKPTVASIIDPVTQQCPPLKDDNNTTKIVLAKSNNSTLKEYDHHQQQDLVLMRGNKADYLVPLSKGCKESRRSLLIWQPYCIATS